MSEGERAGGWSQRERPERERTVDSDRKYARARKQREYVYSCTVSMYTRVHEYVYCKACDENTCAVVVVPP